MEIRYIDDVSKLKEEQLAGFFVGWPAHPDRRTHLKILQQSYKAWVAMDGDRCVGFINALSDGFFYSYIPLLEVLPEYKGKGIGTKLVECMTESLRNMYAVDIVCDEDVVPFYKDKGFIRCAGMVKRNYENQGGGKKFSG
ncbi:MAG: GNAT family N-acetyltransferase [Candidatus Eremiobacterota bacterium]